MKRKDNYINFNFVKETLLPSLITKNEGVDS